MISSVIFFFGWALLGVSSELMYNPYGLSDPSTSAYASPSTMDYGGVYDPVDYSASLANPYAAPSADLYADQTANPYYDMQSLLNKLAMQQYMSNLQGAAYLGAKESYGQQDQGYGGYQQQQKPHGYHQPMMKPKVKIVRKRVYVPVPIKHNKKKKQKTITVMRGMYIPGGQQLFGKFKSLKKCEKACDKIPNCFGGDFNKWLYKCYIHTNYTACGDLSTHPKLWHFKKVPCSATELGTTHGRVILGAQLFRGFEQKGIKDVKTCLKKCTSAGGGIAATITDAENTQICYAINFDFSNHKCYFFPMIVNNIALCVLTVGDGPITDLVPNRNVITVIICPLDPAKK